MRIEKLDDVNDVNFNSVDVKRCLRVMAGTINQIIDVLNDLQEEPYTADIDEADEEETPAVLSPKDFTKDNKMIKKIKR